MSGEAPDFFAALARKAVQAPSLQPRRASRFEEVGATGLCVRGRSQRHWLSPARMMASEPWGAARSRSAVAAKLRPAHQAL